MMEALVSRGYGKMQRFWLTVMWCSTEAKAEGYKPHTFDEICRSCWPEAYEPGCELRPSLKRSLRRALKSFTDDNVILALGKHPARYCIHPVYLKERPDELRKLMEHLKPFGFLVQDGKVMMRHHHIARGA